MGIIDFIQEDNKPTIINTGNMPTKQDIQALITSLYNKHGWDYGEIITQKQWWDYIRLTRVGL